MNNEHAELMICPRCKATLMVAPDQMEPDYRAYRCCECGQTFWVTPPIAAEASSGCEKTETVGLRMPARLPG
jgi:predicted Zn finger-like uncharacterized protein